MLGLLASIVVVTNIGFTAGFDTAHRNPSWVAYDLEPHEVVKAERLSVSFRPDPRIAESDVAEFYRHGPFDRGHLVPAADMNWSTNALRETYYFSNISPQVPRVNRGIWRKVEEEVRNLARSGTVHVVVVPLLPDQASPDLVTVPDGFLKVAYGYFGARFWLIQNK